MREYRNANSLLIPSKANRVLHIILVMLLLIALRVWHLAVVQHDSRQEASSKPQHKTVYQAAKRGTITDRFGVPLALNKVQHNVALVYSQIKGIPSIVWTSDENGLSVKHYKRREYIKSLADLLGQILEMEPRKVEDLIHAKALFFNQIPYVLKENITEPQYYRLKMMEKDWPGIMVQTTSRRHYPLGSIAGDLLGYIGPINREEYDSILGEKKMLEQLIAARQAGSDDPLPDGINDDENLEKRYNALVELAYSLNDTIGKSGLESEFERQLRGFRGKKHYFTNSQGQFLKELDGNIEPRPGERLALTLSAELQQFTEELLIQNEKIRATRVAHLGGTTKKSVVAEKQPWIKGGAIIAMNPNNGEILAMASHPHYNPNDFVASNKDSVHRWLEDETYIADIWNGQKDLEREAWSSGHIVTDTVHMTWDHFLNTVLTADSAILNALKVHNTIEDAVLAQRAFITLQQLDDQLSAYTLLAVLYPNQEPYEQAKKPLSVDIELLLNTIQEKAGEVSKSQKILDPFYGMLNKIYDQVLLIDLYRLAVPANKFSDELLKAVGRQTLSSYKEASEAMATVLVAAKSMSQEAFHRINFKQWREENEKTYLKEKREEEKKNHTYARPYIDYLDAKEKAMFQEFWQKHHLTIVMALLLGPEGVEEEIQEHLSHLKTIPKAYTSNLSAILGKLPTPLKREYLSTLRSYQELDGPLAGLYRSLRKNDNLVQLEKHLAAGFYPKYGYGYARSCSYRQSATQGSIFKLVTSYAALIQQYNTLKGIGIGTAALNPLEMIDTVFTKGKELYVGFDADGKPIPRFYKGGRLPKSSMATIGKIDLLKAIETSSNPYFSLLAGDYLHSPEDLANAARALSLGHRTGIELPGEITGNIPKDLATNRTGLYSFAIGQHTLVVTPIQTAVMLSTIANGGKVLQPKIVGPKLDNVYVKRRLFLPDEVRSMLLQGMCRVVSRAHHDSMRSITKMYHDYPQAIQDYGALKYLLAGKTSTAESIETIDLDATHGTNIYTHIWFGGILFDQPLFDDQQRFVFKDRNGNPELVVVVYLRYGGFGKEAAPIAAQVANKWREINQHKIKG